MNHVEKMRMYIENGLKEFTHRDIILKTNNNCPYSTLRQLKKYYDIGFEECEKSKTIIDSSGNAKEDKVRFRKFIIKGKKGCQKT